MGFKGTRQVARQLNIPVTRLSQAVWAGRIAEPEKGPGGNFCWSEADIQRAARYFNVKLKQEVSNE